MGLRATVAAVVSGVFPAPAAAPAPAVSLLPTPIALPDPCLDSELLLPSTGDDANAGDALVVMAGSRTPDCPPGPPMPGVLLSSGELGLVTPEGMGDMREAGTPGLPGLLRLAGTLMPKPDLEPAGPEALLAAEEMRLLGMDVLPPTPGPPTPRMPPRGPPARPPRPDPSSLTPAPGRRCPGPAAPPGPKAPPPRLAMPAPELLERSYPPTGVSPPGRRCTPDLPASGPTPGAPLFLLGPTCRISPLILCSQRGVQGLRKQGPRLDRR